jgi:ribonuclease I
MAGLTCALLVLLSALARAVPAPVPHAYGAFAYYTLALTWQPGICRIDDAPLLGIAGPEHCASDQPRAPLIGLHGLWPSRPQALIRAGVRVQRWWSRGCDLLHHSNEEPRLSATLRAQLAAVVPQLRHSLLAHEYDKHVQCFGFDPARFFTTELALRSALADAPFGRYLAAQRGKPVAHADVVRAFERSSGTGDARALQLQCARDRAGREVLTQLWLTIRAGSLAAFPAATSLTHTPIDADTCPATFIVPAW